MGTYVFFMNNSIQEDDKKNIYLDYLKSDLSQRKYEKLHGLKPYTVSNLVKKYKTNANNPKAVVFNSVDLVAKNEILDAKDRDEAIIVINGVRISMSINTLKELVRKL